MEETFDKDHIVTVNKNDIDPILPVEHFAQIGENIVSCIFAIEQPQNKINTIVTCPKCGQKFKIVWFEGPDGPVKI